jgi:transcriptional regulator of heat shock response
MTTSVNKLIANMQSIITTESGEIFTSKNAYIWRGKCVKLLTAAGVVTAIAGTILRRLTVSLSGVGLMMIGLMAIKLVRDYQQFSRLAQVADQLVQVHRQGMKKREEEYNLEDRIVSRIDAQLEERLAGLQKGMQGMRDDLNALFEQPVNQDEEENKVDGNESNITEEQEESDKDSITDTYETITNANVEMQKNVEESPATKLQKTLNLLDQDSSIDSTGDFGKDN